MAGKTDAVLSIDIGGSKLQAGCVGYDGAILCKKKTGWEKLDGDTVIQTVIKETGKILESSRDINVTGIGVNIPGLADSEAGLWVEACFSGIRNVPIGDILFKQFRLPVFIDNDVNNCALAEKLFGVCRDCTDFIWLTVSNGCGGALFLDNRVYRGVRGTAGELGHICVEEKGGYLCGCGNHGCLEAQAAGPGITRRFLDAGGTQMINGNDVSSKDIAELARTGDARAADVFTMEGYYIGKALAAVINAINPQKAVIGGGISGAFDLFYPELIKTVDRMTYRQASSHTLIERTGLGYDAALIGAASLALTQMKTVIVG